MKRGHRTVFFLLLLLLLGGCSAVPGAGKGAIDFEEIFEARRNDENQVVSTTELDVDGDSEEEWVVLYRYDPYLEEDWDNTPVQAIVYDALPCDPPLIHNWTLPFPDNDYLGEGARIRVFLDDWLDSSDARETPEELVFYGEGPANTLSIYRFHDYNENFPCRPVDDSKQGFSLLGFFRSNGRILWDVRENEDGSKTTIVTTFQRTAYERSQLAIKSVYAPLETAVGDTFIGANGRTIGPQEQTVAFMFGTPDEPVESPYPEKAVAAFFLALGAQGNNGRARELLTPELAQQFDERTWGLDLRPDQLNRVLIYSISYTPDRDAELTYLEREVSAVVVPVDTNNQRLAPRRLTWRVRGFYENPDDNPEDCEWRLADLIGVEVTPGLGYDVTPGVRDLAHR